MDDLPFTYPDVTPPMSVAKAKPCRHPRDARRTFEGGVACGRCGREIDPARARQGKSSRRLGADQERRIERVYGPVKRGEYGDAVDHIGVEFKWQSKATRGAAPLWMAAVTEATWMDWNKTPRWIRQAIHAMTPIFVELHPLVIRSFVKQGTRTRDYIFVLSRTWEALYGGKHGLPGVYAMTGKHFLEMHGRDSDEEIQPLDPYTEDLAG